MRITSRKVGAFSHRDIVGDRLDQPAEHVIAGEAEYVIDAVGIAEVHHLGAGIMAVAANGDVSARPVVPDHPQQASQMTAYLLP